LQQEQQRDERAGPPSLFLLRQLRLRCGKGAHAE
jgi:hypothetical protein